MVVVQQDSVNFIMNDLSDDEAFVDTPPPPQRTVFDYVRLLDAKAVDRLFGKG